jgi:hypothetical protein
LKISETATPTEAMLMDLIIPSDNYAKDLADQFNTEYGLNWIPEYVQYLATKADLKLDDNLIDHLSVYAHHEALTNHV